MVGVSKLGSYRGNWRRVDPPSEGATPNVRFWYVLLRQDSIENLGLSCVFLFGWWLVDFLAVVLMLVIARREAKESKTWGFKKKTTSESDFKSFVSTKKMMLNNFSISWVLQNVPTSRHLDSRTQVMSCFAICVMCLCSDFETRWDVVGSSHFLYGAWRECHVFTEVGAGKGW